MMGIAAWRISGNVRSGPALTVFCIQLALNAAWTPTFFGLHALGLALAVIVAMWAAILTTILSFWPLDRVAALLLVPYLLWVSFATVLNAELWRLNSGQ